VNPHFFETTRGQILLLLRGGARTVNDLAEELELTDNAIRAHLAALERDGLVRTSGLRAGLRKPHVVYELTAESERIFPKNYAALLDELLGVLKDKYPAKAIDSVLREVGRRIAEAHQPKSNQRSLDSRLRHAIAVLGELGGAARIEIVSNDHVLIRGNDCPLASVAANHAEACHLAETLLSELIGVPVHEKCDRSGKPKCCFEVESTPG
jgi:predicted ArsR family transcriptional regulator